MKLLIFGIAFITLGAIGQAKTANIEFGEAKIRSEYSSRAVYGKALLRPWENDWRRHTNLPPVASQRAVSPAYNQSTFVDKP